MLLPAAAGIGLAVVTIFGVRLLPRTRRNAFAALLLVVAAHGWIVLALRWGDGLDIAFHLATALAFTFFAAASYVHIPRLLGAGFVAHGLFDVAVPLGPAPVWFPPASFAYDVVIGVWLLRTTGDAET